MGTVSPCYLLSAVLPWISPQTTCCYFSS